MPNRDKKDNGITFIRRLYQQVLSLSLSKKKKQYLFKRFFKFEKEFGTKDSQTQVQNMVKDYITSQL